MHLTRCQKAPNKSHDANKRQSSMAAKNATRKTAGKQLDTKKNAKQSMTSKPSICLNILAILELDGIQFLCGNRINQTHPISVHIYIYFVFANSDMFIS